MCLYFPIDGRPGKEACKQPGERRGAARRAAAVSLITRPRVTSTRRLNPECFHDRGAWSPKSAGEKPEQRARLGNCCQMWYVGAGVGAGPQKEGGVLPASPGLCVQPWSHPLRHPLGLRSERELPESSEASLCLGWSRRAPHQKGLCPEGPHLAYCSALTILKVLQCLNRGPCIFSLHWAPKLCSWS